MMQVQKVEILKYLVMVKLNPNKHEFFYDSLRMLADKPVEGVKINSVFNTFGAWDCGLWLESENNDAAMRFISEKIRTIDGVNEITTIRTSPLDLHSHSGREFISSKLNVDTPVYFYTGH